MSDNYRKESRKDWIATGVAVPSIEQLSFGALQRIADATELMAKRHSELIGEKERAESSRDYWRNMHDSIERTNRSLRGQITKLKKQLKAGQ